EYPGRRFSLQLTPGLPPVHAIATDLQCLVRLLIEWALEADDKGPITLRTSQNGTHALLRVEDQAPHVPTAMLSHLFEPFRTVRNEQRCWKLAGCKAIARRLQGIITGENRQEPGMALTVKLPLAAAVES